MKRSRACDDLVALAAETSDHISELPQCNVDTWTSFVEGPATHRLKRPRAAVSSFSSSSFSNETDDYGLQKRHALQCALGMNDPEEVTLSDDDSLPLRWNSREKMLLRKKTQRIAEMTKSFNDFSIHDKDARTLHHLTPWLTRPQSVELLPETPEPRILRGLCYPRKTRCIDRLDKRQAQPFDMSALRMLSLSSKR
ncbi:unnamed protein product [Peronospora destructor]|uniref:Uncharacterized protein n=1 Tax=Peronospora destructor TaxID=86335 RepID=A0AAV0V2P2_9STRA|nr:unnamed protein product [Peronospora destructor]